MNPLVNIKEAQALANLGAIFFINHSGGKDSQAQFLKVLQDMNIPKEQIVVIHADLGRFEWGEETDTIAAKDFVINNAKVMGHETIVVEHDQNLFDLIRRYKRWPSTLARFCTSSLKTTPIEKYIAVYAERTGNYLIVNCLGLRAMESNERSKGQDKECFDVSKVSYTLSPNPGLCRKTKKVEVDGKLKSVNMGLKVYNWYPIFDLTEDEVFETIEDAGQTPHPAYKEFGMSRLSCICCTLASKGDLIQAQKRAPSLYLEYADLEKEIDKTVFTKKVKGKTILVPLLEYLSVPSKKRIRNYVKAHLDSEAAGIFLKEGLTIEDIVESIDAFTSYIRKKTKFKKELKDKLLPLHGNGFKKSEEYQEAMHLFLEKERP